MIDSGADESLFPASTLDRSLPRSSDLVAANGTAIRTYGRRLLPVSFADNHSSHHYFWIADVARPLLGAPYFRDEGLLIDLCNRHLSSQRQVGLHFPASLSRSPGIPGLRLPTQGPYESILEKYPALLSPSFKGEVKHKVKHYIPTTGPPLHARPRRLEGEKLRVAKEEFLKMEKLGIVRQSDSPWASPLHVVPKPDGSWRPCSDYRRLNIVTTDDRYPLPHIQDFNGRLAGTTVFSVVDLVKGSTKFRWRTTISPKPPSSHLSDFLSFSARLLGSKTPLRHFSG